MFLGLKKTNRRNSFIRICMGNDTYVLEPKKKQQQRSMNKIKPTSLKVYVSSFLVKFVGPFIVI